MRRTFVVIFCLFLAILLLALALPNGGSVPVYMTRGNTFSECFKEPVELLVFIAKNGNFYSLTNFDSTSVSIVYEELEYILEKDGLTTKDLMCVVHNHITPPDKFTMKDIRFYNFLRSKGFNGWFLLWSSSRRKITDWRDRSRV